MFNFNDVIENNNSTNIIDNIHHDFLDINVVFFNCYKLLIKAELQDNNWYFISNLVKELDIIYKEDPSKYIQYFDIYGALTMHYFPTQIKPIPEEIEKLERPQPYFRKACTDGTFELYFTEASPNWLLPLSDINYNTYIRFKK